MINGLLDVPGIEDYIRPSTRNESFLGPPYDYKIPAFDATLWRYIDFTKLVSFLEDQTIFFARADKLGDPFEGACRTSITWFWNRQQQNKQWLGA